MRIGLDFDNTIICYDEVFRTGAVARGLLEPGFSGSKQQVRDAIRLLPDGELKWQALQGYVYGKGIGGAAPFPGLTRFLTRARDAGDTVVIVSHKTEYGHFDPDRVSLRQAARDWMTSQRFFEADGFRLLPENVNFAATRAEKLQRIGELACDVFIDDLEEVLGDPDFPVSVRRILFSDSAESDPALPYLICRDWTSIEETVFDQRR